MSDPAPNAAPAGSARPPCAETSAAQRSQLVRAYQEQALAQPEPLVANLTLIASDLMSLAHYQGPAVQAQLAALDSPADCEDYRRACELYLKVLRQIERFASIEQRLTAQAGRAK